MSTAADRSTVVVTGGAGAIGSRVVRVLSERYRVVVLDDLSSGHLENLRGVEVEFRKGSVEDDKALAEAFDGEVVAVVHLAASFANQNSVDHPERDLRINGVGTLKVLQRAMTANVRRFVYASSSSVYGPSPGALSEDVRAFSQSTPYAITKLLGEQYATFFHKHHALPTVVLRLFNSYGPGEFPGRYRNVIPNFIRRALVGEPILITGTGEETRDFTFVDDVAGAFKLALERDAAVGGTFNIGSGTDTSINDLVVKLERATGRKLTVVRQPRRDWDAVTRRLADISRARTALGYSPATGLDDGLQRTVEWFRGLDLSALPA